MYTLAAAPARFRRRRSQLLRHRSGEPYEASVSFDSVNPDTGGWECTLSVSAWPQFPRPFPFWSSPAQGEKPDTTPEKVSCLPSPGIMVRSAEGYVFYWIDEDVLHQVRAEYQCPREEATKLVEALALIKG